MTVESKYPLPEFLMVGEAEAHKVIGELRDVIEMINRGLDSADIVLYLDDIIYDIKGQE